MPIKIVNEEELKKMLSERVNDLFFPSETDAPIEAVSFDKTSDPRAFLRDRQTDKADQIAETDFEEFHNMYGVEKDWQNEIQKQFAKRFGAALNLMDENLENIKVYRLGSVRIDIYILGRFQNGSIIGLKTSVVET